VPFQIPNLIVSKNSEHPVAHEWLQSCVLVVNLRFATLPN
jgi:hypothetical protein